MTGSVYPISLFRKKVAMARHGSQFVIPTLFSHTDNLESWILILETFSEVMLSGYTGL
jgi:hypothetical protein